MFFNRSPDPAPALGLPYPAADGDTKTIDLRLPRGFAGNPQAVPQCPISMGELVPPSCPPESQVGTATVAIAAPGKSPGPEGYGVTDTGIYPIYNMVPRRGKLAEFLVGGVAFNTYTNVPLEIRMLVDRDYQLSALVSNAPAGLALLGQVGTFWAVPWAPEHDRYRPPPGFMGMSEGFHGAAIPVDGLEPGDVDRFGQPADPVSYDPSWGPVRPFLANPPGPCDGEPLLTELRVDSWQFPADPADPSDPRWQDYEAAAPPLTGCGKPGFEPEVAAAASERADSPSGLEFELEIPQNESLPLPTPGPEAGEAEVDQYLEDAVAHWRSEAGIATSQLEDTTVELPRGFAVNPAAAGVQGACSPEQIGLLSKDPIRFDASAPDCPDASKIGTVTVETPLLSPEDWPSGEVYLASQGENPFGSDFAIYLAVESPERALRVKLAGEVEADPDTGRLSTSFHDNPKLPFERFRLTLRGGPRAPLATPPLCGEHRVSGSFEPYARPTGAALAGDDLPIDSSPAGGCPGSESELPLAPGLAAGALNPIAGAHSPFHVRVTRPDGHQALERIEVSAPEGLLARLRGVPYCPEAGIARAIGRDDSGDGARERRDPSCPAPSRVGATSVGVGAGPEPFFASGNAYLAGPYEGAPLSLAFVVPAVAGPFDLGVQVVRAALRLDPRTAKITAVSDPLPKILRGVPLRIRDVRVSIDRPAFTLNPTDCSEQLVGTRIGGSGGALAELASRFQVGGCRALGFKPSLELRLFGGVKRGEHQGLRAVVRARPGDANIGRTVVRMPKSAFLAQEHIRTVCTRVQFAADACPKGAVYGRAIAWSPLLDHPLAGNVYLRSSNNTLPDLVADLRGPAHQPIRVELVGRTDSVNGALRNTFDVVPDAPVSYFRLNLFGKSKGLIVNSRHACAGKNRAAVRMDAHNGRRALLRPVLRNKRCAKLRKAKRKQRRAVGREAKRGGRRR
jgi:hypothetical protein